jgi:tetratricopeptide (TPR) repeat protein
MNVRALFSVAAVAVLALASVRSSDSMGTKPDPPPTPPSSSTSSALPSGSDASVAATGARLDAERAYALAYEDLAKARKDADSGNKKNADKKYRKALERVENAVYLDSTYAEAWNLVGYAARRLGDYDKSFAAYDRCLALKPDFAAAREYLGEAWLEKGNLDKARAQFAILEKANAESEESKALRGAIATYVAAHPQAAQTDSSAAPADTASTQTGVK